MRVFVYWNLHRNLWSVKALEGPDKGRVIHRTPFLILSDVEGRVSEAGRQRVLREGRKNVHAGIVGTWAGLGFYTDFMHIAREIMGIGDRITYNPRKYQSFVHAVDESRFEGAAYAVFDNNRAVYVA